MYIYDKVKDKESMMDNRSWRVMNEIRKPKLCKHYMSEAEIKKLPIDYQANDAYQHVKHDQKESSLAETDIILNQKEMANHNVNFENQKEALKLEIE